MEVVVGAEGVLLQTGVDFEEWVQVADVHQCDDEEGEEFEAVGIEFLKMEGIITSS